MLRPGKTLNSVHMLTVGNPVMVGGALVGQSSFFCFVLFWLVFHHNQLSTERKIFSRRCPDAGVG